MGSTTGDRFTLVTVNVGLRLPTVSTSLKTWLLQTATFYIQRRQTL